MARGGQLDFEAVAELCLALPDVSEAERWGRRAWVVKKKMFAWERPFSQADIRRYGDQPIPGGQIIGVRCADLEMKELVLASGTPGVFTIPHFDGYAAVLVHLPDARRSDVAELLLDAWSEAVPRAVAAQVERHPLL